MGIRRHVNPEVIETRGKIVMLCRAQGKQGTSRLGYAESAEGIHFNRRNEPVLTPTESYEKSFASPLQKI